MKTFRHILTLIFLTLTLFACDDTSFSDPHLMPVKMSGVRIHNLSFVKPLPDGTVAYPVVENGGVRIAKISRDGTVTYSELVDEFDPNGFAVNASGECLVSGKKVVKYDRLGKIAFIGDNTDYTSMLLDNGDICYSQNYEYEGYRLEIHTVGNNFVYVINGEECWNDALPFDDKWFAFNYNNLFCIFDADGNVVCNGELDGSVASLKYINGYLYIIVNGGFVDLDAETVDYITKWSVVKMTTDGRIIYNVSVENTDIYNITVHDGKLFVAGDVITDITKDGTYGMIYVLDDTNGGVLSAIPTEYKGCQIVPLYISPDFNGEYDVYAARRDNYESDYPQLVLYHTDDLSRLNIEN